MAPPCVIGADGAIGFALDAGKAQLAAVVITAVVITYKIVRRL